MGNVFGRKRALLDTLNALPDDTFQLVIAACGDDDGVLRFETVKCLACVSKALLQQQDRSLKRRERLGEILSLSLSFAEKIAYCVFIHPYGTRRRLRVCKTRLSAPAMEASPEHMANHTEDHCPLSRCVTEPGYCNSEIEDDQFRGLLVIVCVPLLLAFLSPIVASLFSLHFRSGSCCHGDDDRPARAPMHRSAIDPPMFLGGVGLLPLECGFSGLLTIIWVMSATFVGTFFYLLNQSHPCSTALGECRTISCICGNAISEGYVFMFCCLYATEGSNTGLADPRQVCYSHV